MGKFVDRDYLWLRETPQKSPRWRPWAPVALVPVAAALAWYLTTPTDAPPADEATAPTVARVHVQPVEPAHAMPVNFSRAFDTARARPPARSVQLAFAPAASLTHGPNQPNDAKPDWQRVTIASGDTLSLAFARHGLSYMDSLRIAHMPHLGHYFTRGLQAGDVLEVKADDTGRVQAIRYTVDALHHLSVRRSDDGFTATLAERSAEHRQTSVSGAIRHSFYRDALAAGLTDRQAASLHDIFARDVDFARDIQPGDRFIAVYDTLYDKQKQIGTGPIAAAALINNGQVIRAVRYTDDNGHSEYYRPNGRPMRPAFVRAPVQYTRISSPFNLNRMHPILHRIRRHEGTDYAAPEGAPIHATGDGRIIFRGRRGGYGNVVIIRHNRHITMRFAHMSRFARGLHVGSRVREGQTIGYVGMTGLATGPHVHYEFRVDGRPRNPQTVPLPGAPPLQGHQLAAFKARDAALIAKLDDMTDNARVHMASAADSP
ncbi:OapA family protein [Salinisphaera sp. LB1]|uniref:OapA family protein n=1 Tax=Salinisphaera sp. LB1 TaxID=2183911 RepID=UPI000D7053C4|nr:peptidoglycan DD-metalloendopeptidase family protein [Salinisphaera sp. LB1]AWN15910.1 Membrane protein related to metalloendopeptidase [Salinisphaera sp. LB1]